MNDIVLFLAEHPRDAVAITASILVVYLLNAIKKLVEKDFTEMRTTQLQHSAMLVELRVSAAKGTVHAEEVSEVRRDMHEVKSRLKRLEHPYNGNRNGL